MRTTLISTATVLLLSLQAPAQPADTLSGPTVPPAAIDSIAATDMNGNFIPVEGRPELAAFMIVCDNPDDLAKARELGPDHIFDLAELLVDEIETVREVTDAIAAGNAPYAQTLMGSMRLKADPDLQRDPLRADLETMLDEAQKKRFADILDEYWTQWVAANTPEDQLNMQGNPRDKSLSKRIENKLNNQLFQQDIASAYEYSLRRYRDAMQAMYDAIEPTDEQRTWIRNRVIEHIEETRLKATNEQREALMLEIYDMLDESRRVKLFAYMTRAALARN